MRSVTSERLLTVFIALIVASAFLVHIVHADSEGAAAVNAKDQSRVGSATDAEANIREEEAISADGLSTAERKLLAQSQETHEFQAEVGRLMDIIINSLYSNREIFLRELISNAADAIDKIRFEGLTDKAKLETKPELEIRITYDKEKRTVTVHDSGIGMTREQLIKNLGVVAHSGTTEFLDRANSGGDTLSLIGQFGVGFYSVYLVAEEVTVISKHNDDDQYIWKSNANKTYNIAKDPRGNTLGRGTQVILHLKEDASEYLNEETLKRIVGKYSEFIQYPIFLQLIKDVERDVPVEEEPKEEEAKPEGEDKKEDDLEVKEDEEKEEDTPKQQKTKRVKERSFEWVQVNAVKAIWMRNPSDITEEEYEKFYNSLTKDDKGIMTYSHFKAEGEISFRSILYIPKKAPEGFFDRFHEKSQSLKLFVRRVLISDEFEDFMPRYLAFIKGVVDSDDLPLNVSRETLAQSRVLKVMGKKLTRKALDMIKKLAQTSESAQAELDARKADKKEDGEISEEAQKELDDLHEDAEKYPNFWKEFGKAIKLGVIDDRANKVALAKLVRFTTSKSESKLRSLENYLSDMSDKQEFIYYITGESLDMVKKSPFLERVVKKGFEVIYLTDPLDEYLVQQLPEFEGRKLQSITKEGLKLGDEDQVKARQEKLEEEFKELTTWMKKIYDEKVEKVTVSHRLTNSPCVVVTSQYGWTANMERIMKAQTFGDQSQQQWMKARKTLEINPRHPLIKELKERAVADPEDKEVIELSKLLLDSALLISGFAVDNVADVASRVMRVISMGLKVDPNTPVDEEEEIEETPAPASSSSDASSSDASDDATPASSSSSSSSSSRRAPADEDKDEL